MNWETAAAIAEVVSAIAVVVSLIYLASQIRQNTSQIDQNTKAVRAAAVDSSVGHAMDARKPLIENAEVMRIWIAGSKDPLQLNDEELFRYRLSLYNAMASQANLFAQAQYAELAEDAWESQIPAIQRTLSTSGGSWFWEKYGDEFEQGFQKEIARIMSNSAGDT